MHIPIKQIRWKHNIDTYTNLSDAIARETIASASRKHFAKGVWCMHTRGPTERVRCQQVPDATCRLLKVGACLVSHMVVLLFPNKSKQSPFALLSCTGHVVCRIRHRFSVSRPGNAMETQLYSFGVLIMSSTQLPRLILPALASHELPSFPSSP